MSSTSSFAITRRGSRNWQRFRPGTNQLGVRREGSNHPAESLIGEFVSGNAFDTLGLRAYAGRLLKQSDDEKGAPSVAVMSYRTWQQKYGEDPSVVGASFQINGQPFTIVGITPPGFFGERLEGDPASFWMPLNKEPQVLGTNSVLDAPELDWLNLIGRIQPGANQKRDGGADAGGAAPVSAKPDTQA